MSGGAGFTGEHEVWRQPSERDGGRRAGVPVWEWMRRMGYGLLSGLWAVDHWAHERGLGWTPLCWVADWHLDLMEGSDN